MLASNAIIHLLSGPGKEKKVKKVSEWVFDYDLCQQHMCKFQINIQSSQLANTAFIQSWKCFTH